MKRFLASCALLVTSYGLCSSSNDHSYSQTQKVSEHDKWPMYFFVEGKKGIFYDRDALIKIKGLTR